MKIERKKNWLLGVGIILVAILIATPALAESGQFTGCLGVKTQEGTLYNIQAGESPISDCKEGDIILSFYDINAVNMLKENESALQGEVNDLKENTSALQAEVDELKDNISDLKDNVGKLQSILQGVTHTGTEIYITGANLHILSGSGSTEGTVNGLGNLIIGYNENRSSGNSRTGSHNLILGKENNYLSYGGIVSGWHNDISNRHASVTGGQYNIASGPFSSITGGGSNTASGQWSSINGGLFNRAVGGSSWVSGGQYNTVSGSSTSVAGGMYNTASGLASSVSGGYGNTAGGRWSSISGGLNNNNATGDYDWMAGNSGTLYTGQFFANQ